MNESLSLSDSNNTNKNTNDSNDETNNTNDHKNKTETKKKKKDTVLFANRPTRVPARVPVRRRRYGGGGALAETTTRGRPAFEYVPKKDAPS